MNYSDCSRKKTEFTIAGRPRGTRGHSLHLSEKGKSMKLIRKGLFALLGISLLSIGGLVAVNAQEAMPVEVEAATVSDEITVDTAGVTSSGTSYSAWSPAYTSATTGITYAGKSASNNGTCIQIKSKDSDTGIVVTSNTNGYILESIDVVWNRTSGTLNVYGASSAYDAPSDLFSSTTYGQQIGSIVASSATKYTVASGEYQYVGVRSNSGAMYLTSITFNWASAAETTSVSISGSMTKTAYADGEAWNTDGLTVTAYDSEGGSKEILHDDAGLSWNFTPTAPQVGETSGSVTVTYDGKTSEPFSFSYTCASRELQSITLNTDSVAKSYTVGDQVSYEGLVVTGNYNVGDPITITEGYTIDPADGSTLSTAGTITVTVTYEGKEAAFEINVVTGPIMDYTFSSALSKGALTLDEVSWTFTMTNSSATTGYNASDGRGMQIGSRNDATSSVFRSEIISGFRITQIIINAAIASSGNTTMVVKLGDTQIESQNLTTTSTDYTFDVATPAAGHIEIDFNNTSRAHYIKAITIYGVAESDGIANAAKLIEVADICSKTGLDEAISAYDALSDAAKAECDAIMLDDYQDGDTAHASAKTYNRLSVAEKMIAIRNANAAASTSPALFTNATEGNTPFIYIFVVLGGAIVISSFIFFKKRRSV